MKKLVLAALLATFAAGASAADKINFGVSATYPPFESLDASNQIVGFDIDLAKALCKQMQADCTFTNHAFDSLIPSLKFKKYDAVISGMDITPERSKQVAFTDPYYANSAVVIAKKGAYKSFDELKGKRIGMERPLYPHLMRHTFASHALSAGMDLTVIQHLLGHTDPKTTLIYAEINPIRVQYEYNRVIA